MKCQGKVIYVHVYIISDFPITNTNALWLCQSECVFLQQTVNMVVFFLNIINTYPKGRALMQTYRVVSQTKRGNTEPSDKYLLLITILL